jgi:hypothetical protein
MRDQITLVQLLCVALIVAALWPVVARAIHWNANRGPWRVRRKSRDRGCGYPRRRVE